MGVVRITKMLILLSLKVYEFIFNSPPPLKTVLHVFASRLSLPRCRFNVVASQLSLPRCRFQVVASELSRPNLLALVTLFIPKLLG